MNSFLTSKIFWADTIERSVKTAAQSVLLAIGAAEGFNLFMLDAKVALGAALGGAVISLLTSLVSGQVTAGDSASLVIEPKEI